MSLPNPQTITDKIARRFEKIASSKTAAAVFDLLTGKYVFFFSFAVVLVCTLKVPLEQLSQTDTMLYYALPVGEGMFYPNSFFGIFEPLIGNFAVLSAVLKELYFVLLIVIALVMMFWLERIGNPVKRMEFIAVVGVFISLIISSTSYKNQTMTLTSLILNLVLALALLGLVSVITRSLKIYTIPAAVVITAVSQILECRTIMIITPALLFLFVFAKSFVGKKAINLRVLCIAMEVTSLAALLITNSVSENNSYDKQALDEYLLAVGDPSEELEFVNVYYLLRNTVFKQLNVYGAASGFSFFVERAFIFNNGLLLIAALIISIAIKKRKTAKQSGKTISFFGALWDTLKIDEENKTSKILFWGVVLVFVYANLFLSQTNIIIFLIYLAVGLWIFKKEGFKNPFGETPDCKRFFGLSLLFILIKHTARILIHNGRPFAIMHYYVSYQQFGFMPRAMIGTIFNAIFGYEISQNELIPVLKVLFFLMLGILVLFIARNYYRTKGEFDKKLVFIISFAFLVSPGFMIFSQYDNLYKLDLFNITLAVLCLALSIKNNVLVWLIPPLCLLAMMTHQVFTCTIFPLLFIILVYRAFINSGNHSVRNISVLFLSFFVVAGVFFYLTFVYESPTAIDAESAMEVVYDRSGGYFTIEDYLFKSIWFDNGVEHVERMRRNISYKMVINAALFIILTLPLLYMYCYALSRSAKMEKKILPKLAFLVMGLSVLMIFPPFFTDTDYGRWFAYYLFVLLISLAIITRLQPEDKKWYADMNKEYLLKFYLAYAVLLSSFQTFETILWRFYAFLP